MSSINKLFFLSITLSTIFSLSCLNSQGQKVDWWVYLKTPSSIYEDTSYFAMYYDSTMNSTNFEFIAQRIDHEGGALYNTLKSTQSSEYELIVWNDENPVNGSTASAPAAHSKGVIGLDSSNEKGFYMQHSMPKYPNITNGQIDPEIDDSQLKYGQNMMCLSVTADTLESMGANLLIIKAYVYFTQGLSSKYPNLQLFADRKYNKTISSLNLNFTLDSGLPMKMFSKSGYFQSEFIFEHQIVPTLQTSLYCETWGRPYQNATCDITTTDYFVEEVLYLNYSKSGVAWKSTKDHSKWTIGANEAAPWVCFGDIVESQYLKFIICKQNKMKSQSKRGGSYFCMLNDQVWKLMRQAITQKQSCDDNEVKEEEQQYKNVTLQQLIFDAIQRRKYHNN